jgi:hypothetical protein
MFETFKTLVLKTATVTGVKLAAPADRIGLGFGVATYSADPLSPGQNSMPRNPEPEHVGSRQELSAMQMPRQMQVGGDAVPPAGSAGCPCAPGVSAVASGSTRSLTQTSWRTATRTTVAGSTREVRLTADHSPADFRRDLRHHDLTGSDCQSPRRSSDKRGATRKVCPAATAGK